MSHSRWRAVLASALVPTAVVFAFPGLVEEWYAKDGDWEDSRNDPPLLLVGQSFAMFFNILASGAFITRFTGSNPVWPSRITFASLVLAILLDLLCLAIFGASHSYSHYDGYELSTAYYLTLASAVMTLMALIALISDSASLRREPKQFLTPKQRSLTLMTYVFMTYLLVVSIMFKYVLDRSFLDSMYFVMSSTLTVGYGDVAPTNLASKILAILVFPAGIIIIGIIISLIRETILASIDERLRRRARMLDERVRAGRRILPWVKSTVREKDKKDPDRPEREREDNDVREAEQTQLSYEESLRQAIRQNQKSSFKQEIIVSFVLFLVFWIIGTVVYMKLEGWSFFIAFYFTFMTYTVIGYGDYYPQTPGGRAFYIGWGATGIVILTLLLTLISEAWTYSFSDWLRALVATRVRARSRSKKDGGQPSEPPKPVNDDDDVEHRGGEPSRDSRLSQRSRSHSRSASTRRPELQPESQEGTDLSPQSTTTHEMAQDVRGDLRAVEDKSHTGASPEEMLEELELLLYDCERFLERAVKDDYDGMRKQLVDIIADKDGRKDLEQEQRLMTQEQDTVVLKMMTKHAHNQVTRIIKQRKDFLQHVSDESLSPREKSMKHHPNSIEATDGQS